MALCARVNPEISFSAHKNTATFATSPTLMTEEARVGSAAAREWELPGRARADMAERVVVSVKAMGERVLYWDLAAVPEQQRGSGVLYSTNEFLSPGKAVGQAY